MSGQRFVTEIKAVTRDTFTQCAGLHCDTFTSNVPNCNYDFDSLQPEFVKRISCECLNAARRNSLPLP